MRAGETILKPGAQLGPQEIGLLAGLGRTSVSVVSSPRVAVVPTGDEIVEPPSVPGPGQIRNSNGPMLLALVGRAGGKAQYLGIARDETESLRQRIGAGLAHADMLILCGGVSAGKFDLVPGVLQESGVVPHFHKVAMKPGKPVYFGTCDNVLVFGLPGNPVSSFVCFELFIRPVLRKLRGEDVAQTPPARLPIAQPFQSENDRPTYHPSVIEWGADGLAIRPLPWFGSADLRGIAQANALLVLAPGEQSFRAGELVPAILLDH
jgi:molybdopterin molybdotransferase